MDVISIKNNEVNTATKNDHGIEFKSFYSDWVGLDNREQAIGFARALFRRIPNLNEEERLRIINKVHFRGTRFTMDEVKVKIL